MGQKKPQKAKNSLKTNVLTLCIFLSLLGLSFVYLLDFLENDTNQQNNGAVEMVEFTIAASKLQAPKSWIQSEINPEQSILTLLQLRLQLDIDGRKTDVNASLLAAARAVPSAYLLDSLYIHNFAPGQSEQMYGLVAKKLKNEGGFENETIWYDALSANPFVAKCLDEKIRVENAKNCITTVLVNKRVSALIQFEKSLLPQWRQFSVALGQQLATLNSD